MRSFTFNKSDYKFIGAFVLAATIWLFIKFYLQGYNVRGFLIDIPAALIKSLSLLFIFRWLIDKYIIRKKNYWAFFILGFLIMELIGFLDFLRDFGWQQQIPLSQFPKVSFIIVHSFYFSGTELAFPLILLIGKKYFEYILKSEQIARTQRDLELKVLRSQYDPHFLYNSLNTIDALVEYSPKEKVKEYIAHLAGLYRHLIHTKDEDIVPLENEMELAHNYFYLIETRFERDYSFHIIEKEVPQANYLPNGALLTVLENVVKHNSAKEGKTIETQIFIEKEQITVRNTKNRIKQKGASSGTGLNNLRKRYELLSSREIRIEDNSQSFAIHLPLLKLIS
ncbi:sensor histidine kinase [Spongiimicrobium salis]|uniref:sensor histidine kinase n=1 Tax=Spongiimicrobium salis TaxID=1667022 RepID=UPI00374DC0B5